MSACPDIRIAPSVLSADLARLTDQIQAIEQAGADWIHVDVMDGRFVPNLTFGVPMIEALRRISNLPIDVHLMVVEPEQFLEPFADAGASNFTFHPEATVHVHRHLNRARELDMQAGLALNPSTPLNVIDEVIDDVDLLLIMTVNPGYGGQKYISTMTDKIHRAKQLLDSRNSSAHLQVDGGISPKTIGAARRAGADVFVAGAAIFSTPDPATAVNDLRAQCTHGVIA